MLSPPFRNILPKNKLLSLPATAEVRDDGSVDFL